MWSLSRYMVLGTWGKQEASLHAQVFQHSIRAADPEMCAGLACPQRRQFRHGKNLHRLRVSCHNKRALPRCPSGARARLSTPCRLHGPR